MFKYCTKRVSNLYGHSLRRIPSIHDTAANYASLYPRPLSSSPRARETIPPRRVNGTELRCFRVPYVFEYVYQIVHAYQVSVLMVPHLPLGVVADSRQVLRQR